MSNDQTSPEGFPEALAEFLTEIEKLITSLNAMRIAAGENSLHRNAQDRTGKPVSENIRLDGAIKALNQLARLVIQTRATFEIADCNNQDLDDRLRSANPTPPDLHIVSNQHGKSEKS